MWCPTSASSCAPCAAACSELAAATAAAARRCPPTAARRANARPVLTLLSCLPRACSRQFGHRVKGVSMSTFKTEEVAALEEAGNAVGGGGRWWGRCAAGGCRRRLQQLPTRGAVCMLLLHAERPHASDPSPALRCCPAHLPYPPSLVASPPPLQRFAAFFLHKWQSAALPKPVDRDVHRIHAWIQAVYQDRRFHGEPPGGYALGGAPAAAGGSSTASEVRQRRGLWLPCGMDARCCCCAQRVPHGVHAVGMGVHSSRFTQAAASAALLLPWPAAGAGGCGAAAVRGAGQRHSQAQGAGQRQPGALSQRSQQLRRVRHHRRRRCSCSSDCCWWQGAGQEYRPQSAMCDGGAPWLLTLAGLHACRAGTTPTKAANGSTAARGLNLMDVSSPKSAKSAPPGAVPAAAAAAAWDPFGDSTAAVPEASSSPGAAAAAAAAAGQGGSPRPASAPAGEATWAVFGDTPAPVTEEQQQPAASATASGWEAFGDGPSEPAAAPAAKLAAAAAAAVAAAASPAGSSSPGKPQARQPVRSSSRPEVSMVS